MAYVLHRTPCCRSIWESRHNKKNLPVGIPNNVIKYTASEKLAEISGSNTGGINTDFFNVSIINHTFKNGVGTIEFDGDITEIKEGSYPGRAIGAFVNSPLINITIPNSIISIGSFAFYKCSDLTSITIPNNITSIGNDVFDHCTSLTSITIPNNVTSIGSSAFADCTSLTSITIPNSVTSIGQSVFSGCSGLTSVTISNSVTVIGNYAFNDCTGLTSVEIPNSVTSISQFAFSGCSGLTSITIPNSVTSIGKSAFNGCTGLTEVTIPNSVTSIGDYAFNGCRGLTSITCNATTAPTIQSNTFQNVKTGGTLYVPSGSSGYSTWMGTGNYYLGKYNWSKVEQ